MSDQVKSQTLTVAEMFGPGRRLTLPSYQRSFSWSEREGMAMINDLLEASEAGMTHFIGATVVIEPSATETADGTTPTIEIVDGQQRLTTITILLCVLRDLENDPERAHALEALISHGAVPRQRVPAGWRLTLNHLDGDFFRATIQRRGQAANDTRDPSDSKSQQRMSEVAAGFTREVRRMSEEERHGLQDTLLHRCLMVQVTVPDRDMGYRVFRILNDRGKAPNAHDIIKTDIFERANLSLEEADRYSARWAEYEAQIGDTAFNDLLRQIRMLYDRSSKGDLIASLRKNVIPKITARRFLDDVLPAHVQAFGEIMTGHVDFGPASPQIADYINRMRALDHSGWRAPALKFLVERRGDTKNAVEFFRQLERMAFTLALITPKADQRAKRYRRVAEGIDNMKSLLSRSGALHIPREDVRKLHERLQGRFATFGQRRAMALRMNAALEAGRTLPPEADATVEHVLPRNPDTNSHWLRVWPDPAKRRELCDTLGNFVLLPHSDNQQADTLDYRAKKKVYFNGSGGALFALTRDLEHQDAWTADVVRQRTMRLAEILLSDWGLV